MDSRIFSHIVPLAYTGALNVLTYHHAEQLEAGRLVEIPIGRRSVIGLVLNATTRPDFPTRAIIRPLDVPAVPTELINFAQWLSRYYAAPLTTVWNTMLPAGLGKNRRTPKPATLKTAHGLPVHPLTNDQTAALKAITSDPTMPVLLQGVTGSGKTRVYLELAAQHLAAGRSVIILVPEISLTPQITRQFQDAFGDVALATHSKLTEAERQRIWEAAATAYWAKQARVILGPRSCLFLPVHQLGLIVVDEAHEPSYKQERSPRYHTTLAAAYRAKANGAGLVLGSATPAVTDLFLAQQGKLNHILMQERPNKFSLPEAIIIDQRQKDLFVSSKFIAQELIDAMSETLANGRQSLLYLNRRGSASSQICSDCGYVSVCPNCQLPLTFHADMLRLICHHCNYRRASPAICPECNSSELRLIGSGTKRIEAEITRLFPEARIARLDRDSATLKHLQTVLKQMSRGEIDILVGTQMIAKGLDLPAVDTVGVIGADTMLHLPDYTAAERTFQLVTQVAGRAGRGDRVGRVFIQTYSPTHPAIQAASRHDFAGFAAAELAERAAHHYPPYAYLLKLEVVSSTREGARDRSQALGERLRQIPGLAVIGPAPAFLEMRSGKFHWILTIKSMRRGALEQIAHQIDDPAWSVDLDPINLL